MTLFFKTRFSLPTSAHQSPCRTSPGEVRAPRPCLRVEEGRAASQEGAEAGRRGGRRTSWPGSAPPGKARRAGRAELNLRHLHRVWQGLPGP